MLVACVDLREKKTTVVVVVEDLAAAGLEMCRH